MTNISNTILYVGMTDKLLKQAWQHKNHLVDGFTKKYDLIRLVYYESSEDVVSIISREKQLEAGKRITKIRLNESINRDWHDLYEELTG
jgi:putative endonuclease